MHIHTAVNYHILKSMSPETRALSFSPHDLNNRYNGKEVISMKEMTFEEFCKEIERRNGLIKEANDTFKSGDVDKALELSIDAAREVGISEDKIQDHRNR